MSLLSTVESFVFGQPKSDFPRTLFVLKYRSDSGPYSQYSENVNWGQAPQKEPLSSGLYNSARMVVEMLEEQDVPVKLVHVIDNNGIHKEIVDFKAEVVVIEAFWVVPEKFDELQRVCPNVKFIVRNHSETPFLSQEGIAFDWTLKYVAKPNVYMTCNSYRMLSETQWMVNVAYPHTTYNRKVVYLPNYYPVNSLVIPDFHDIGNTLNIGCFGAVRPLKNHVLQAISAIEFANRKGMNLRFHVNSKRIEMGGSPIIKNLRQLFSHLPNHELVEHDWMPHAEFRKLLKDMDIVMQVSFSETFNIVAADAISQGVLTITSPEVPFSSPLVQADPTNSENIVQTLWRCYDMKLKNPGWNPSLEGLIRYSRDSIPHWISLLKRAKNNV
jgi:hypothetical protein